MNKVLKPIAFLSKKILPAKYNYNIYNKELIVIIRVFKEWRFELFKILIKDSIIIILDYKNL